jgi:hypothetical protein
MAVVFEGKTIAQQKLESLRYQVSELREKNIIPKLISFVGSEKGNIFYTNLKKKAAEEIGAIMEVKNIADDVKKETLIQDIKQVNKDNKVHGIMVQLPLPKLLDAKDRNEILANIEPKKDVDGMGKESVYIAPVVAAIEIALSKGEEHVKHNNLSLQDSCGIGARGVCGTNIDEQFGKIQSVCLQNNRSRSGR